MHISEGVLSREVLAAGAVLTAGGVTVGLRTLDYDRIPQVALLSSAFFVASLIHVPVGPSSAHLILGGLVGMILGWAAFPALLVALLLQAVLFQFGGLTTLGVNTFTMAFPAVVCYHLFNPGARNWRIPSAMAAGFAAGFLSVFLSALLVALCLIGTEQAFRSAAAALFLSHIPIMIIEGLMCATVVGFLRNVRPELLNAPIVRGETNA